MVGQPGVVRIARFRGEHRAHLRVQLGSARGRDALFKRFADQLVSEPESRPVRHQNPTGKRLLHGICAFADQRTQERGLESLSHHRGCIDCPSSRRTQAPGTGQRCVAYRRRQPSARRDRLDD